MTIQHDGGRTIANCAPRTIQHILHTYRRLILSSLLASPSSQIMYNETFLVFQTILHISIFKIACINNYCIFYKNIITNYGIDLLFKTTLLILKQELTTSRQ